MNSNDKKDISLIVCEALDQMVIPRLENIEDNISEMKDTLEIHDSKLDGLIRRLDLEADRRGELESKVQNHEKRLTKVEAKVA